MLAKKSRFAELPNAAARTWTSSCPGQKLHRSEQVRPFKHIVQQWERHRRRPSELLLCL